MTKDDGVVAAVPKKMHQVPGERVVVVDDERAPVEFHANVSVPASCFRMSSSRRLEPAHFGDAVLRLIFSFYLVIFIIRGCCILQKPASLAPMFSAPFGLRLL